MFGSAFLDLFTHRFRELTRRSATRKRAHRAWEAVAKALDAELRYEDSETVGWPCFAVDEGGVDVAVDHVGGTTGQTRVRAKASVATHERVKIYAAEFYSPLARAVGFQDVPLGDEEFDENFIVKANDPVFARAWVNSVVRRRIAQVPDYRFEVRGGRVIATSDGLETNAKSLRAAIRAVAALADGRQLVMARWGKLQKRYGAKLEKREDRWALLRGKHNGVSFRLDTFEHADSHFTTVAARAPQARLEPSVLALERQAVATMLPRVVSVAVADGYVLFSESAQRAAGLFNGASERIIELGVTKIEVESERVTVFIPGICVSTKTLARVIALATDLAQAGESEPTRS